MLIGVPKEIKTNENRIALVPAGAEALVRAGHTVFVEKGAGEGSGFSDEQYTAVGAQILDSVDDVWARAEMIMKVKEPIAVEYPRIRDGQVLFTYFHFAADEALTHALVKSNAIAIAYETVQLPSGELPLLTPMSEVAGRMSIQAGAKYLEKFYGGRGMLLGGVPGVAPANVVIIGGGVVGTNAAKMAAGFGARVTILDLSLDRLRYLSDVMPANVDLIYSNRHNLLDLLETADLLVGAVLLPGAKAPKLVLREDLRIMKKGAVIVDVAVDQGGCVETIRPTTHENPIYEIDGVIHYGVANMPGGVPRTSTLALTNATFPYALRLANQGWEAACRADRALALGLNIVRGKVTYPGVAEAFGLEYTPVEQVMG
ncbi:MAG TPA: alanine dehydrogenase [Longimicrobiaceae bacterium]|nr:alanine dehydrogenase [Longimicrobiaceae bacterium]